MRKDLTCTKVLEIIMQIRDPSSELQYVIVTNHNYKPGKGSVENLHQGMCHYTFVSTLHPILSLSSCSCPSRHKSQTAAGTSSSGVKRGTCKWCRGQKKNTQLLHLLWWTHLQRAPSDMLQVLLERLNTHTHPPTHTHTHRHTLNT